VKLYTHPGASSLSVHILLRETGLPFDLEVVNVTAKTRPDGSDYRGVAPRGMVPLLELDDGTSLTENMVIAQFVCDRASRPDLMPEAGTLARYRVMEWQSFIAAELHKGYIPLRWALSPETMAFARDRLFQRLRIADAALEGRRYLTGDTFTAADAYLFVIAGWAYYFEFDVAKLPHIERFLAEVNRRPAVQAAMQAEGKGLVVIPSP
jgi:glutathione S-transferase